MAPTPSTGSVPLSLAPTFVLAERRTITTTNFSYPSRSVRNILWAGPTIPLTAVLKPSSEAKLARVGSEPLCINNVIVARCLGLAFDDETLRRIRDSFVHAKVTVLNFCGEMRARILCSYRQLWSYSGYPLGPE